MKRALFEALLFYLVVQVLALTAGLTAARLLESPRAGLIVSNVGAVLAVGLAVRYYLRNRPSA